MYSIVHKLNGMWAFAIFDSRNRTLFLSRDRFGEKPLLLSKKDLFIFASELFLRMFSFLRQRNIEIALSKYLAHGYIPAPHSLLENVYKLSAGTNLYFLSQIIK